MSKNRFEQVDDQQPDAISLRFSRTDETETGVVVFPEAASKGRLAQDQISGDLPAVDAFRSAVRLANETKVALVVIDPSGVWNDEWGTLYRPLDD